MQIEGVEQHPYRAVGVALEVIPRTLAQNCGANVIRTLTKLRAKHADSTDCTFGLNGHTGEIVDMKELGVWEPYAVKVVHPCLCHTIQADCTMSAMATSEHVASFVSLSQLPSAEVVDVFGSVNVVDTCCSAAKSHALLKPTAVNMLGSHCNWLAKMHFETIMYLPQVQTIKTSVESAIMLLRIDDIVSGISKKSKGGASQPTGPQTEDHDNVSTMRDFCPVC